MLNVFTVSKTIPYKKKEMKMLKSYIFYLSSISNGGKRHKEGRGGGGLDQDDGARQHIELLCQINIFLSIELFCFFS